MGESVNAGRSRPSTKVLVILIGALALVVVAGGLIATNLLKPTASAARLAIDPAAVLLQAPGETRTLSASTVDGSGAKTPVTATWSSSHPDIVAVESTGAITAKALGSAQITATAGDSTTSAFVIVAAPAPGVMLVTDAQIAGDPAEVPGAAPTDATYIVPLTGLTPAVGDRLLGTGGRALAGEVVAVTTTDGVSSVTMQLVPLPELLPDLVVDETFAVDPAAAEIVPEVARLFDVTRTGTVFTFTAKANFKELQAQSALAFPRGPVAGIGLAAAAPTLNSLFDDCERDGTISDEGPAFWPFTLDDGPTFSVDINPSPTVRWNRDEKRVELAVAPRIEVTLGLTVKAAFSVTWECTQELMIFRVPIFGPASFFLTPLIPVGVGFEIGGELTIAQAGFSLKTSVSATGRLGFACVGTAGCGVIKEWTGTTQSPDFKGSLPSAHDLRFKPEFSAFGFVKAEIGNPILTSLHLEALEAKIGPKVEMDWAPRAIQIADTSYASELKLTLEMGVEISPELDGIADRLGLGDILAVGTENSVDLGRSPTGTLDTSATDLTPGQLTSAKIKLDRAALELLGVYDVERVVLVRSSGGTLTELSSTLATTGSSEFDMPFTAPQLLKTSELFAFVVPRFPPGGVFDFEIGGGSSAGRILFFRLDTNHGGFSLFSVGPDGGNETPLALSIGQDRPGGQPLTATKDGTKIAIPTSGGIYTANADGTNAQKLGVTGAYPAWSPDGSKLLFVTAATDQNETTLVTAVPGGGAQKTIIQGKGFLVMPAWSPDGTQIVFMHARILDPNSQGLGLELWTANADGTNVRSLYATTGTNWGSWPRWSPDSSKVLFIHAITSGSAPGFEIWTVNRDGTNAHALTTGHSDIGASWSPDGTKIVFSRLEQGGGTLWTMSADGANQVQLPTSIGAQTPLWLP